MPERSPKVWDYWILKPFKVVRVECGGLKVKRLIYTYCSWVSILQNLSRLKSLLYLIKLKTPMRQEMMNSSHQKIRKVCQFGMSKQELPINAVLSDITGSTMNAHMLTLQGSKLPTNYLLPRQLLTCSAPKVDLLPLPNLTNLHEVAKKMQRKQKETSSYSFFCLVCV